jgi:hypothetical protein
LAFLADDATGGGLQNWEMKSMGTGKMMVEFFSAAIEFNVCEEK